MKLCRTKFHISSTGKIENGSGMLQVDFANKFVGGGVLGHGCVQEVRCKLKNKFQSMTFSISQEIRFVINPEMIVARLFTECLGDEEALIMIGCEQFNSYMGYAGNFKWAGDFVDNTPLDIYRRRKCRVVAIDALFYKDTYEQFKEPNIRRELNKAYVGFYSDDGNDKAPVATGLWGCGAFNGYSIRSAIIQLLACAVTGRNFVFYTFGDEITKNEISDIFNFLDEKNVSVGQLYQLLKRYRYEGNPKDPTQLTTFLKEKFDPSKLSTTKQTKNQNSSSSNKMKQPTLFNFMMPSSSKPSPSLEKKSEEKLWSWNQKPSTTQISPSTSSVGSRDKQKFADIEETFAIYKSSKPKRDPEAEKKNDSKPMSLIESLDFDMEMSSNKKM